MDIPDELFQRLPDDRTENELAALLRDQPEETKLEVVQSLLSTERTMRSGLRLASRCLRSPESMVAVINRALDKGDASIIPHWVGPFVPRLGFRKLVQLLRERVKTDPKSVAKARYWLPQWQPKDNAPAGDLVAQLDDELRAALPDGG
jgi:hypothetical protein